MNTVGFSGNVRVQPWSQGTTPVHSRIPICRPPSLPCRAVEDFELLSDCAASLQLTPLQPGTVVTDDHVMGLIGKL